VLRLSEILTDDPASRTTPYRPEDLSAFKLCGGFGPGKGDYLHFPIGMAGVRRLLLRTAHVVAAVEIKRCTSENDRDGVAGGEEDV
jgi:hypothetical protein